ncbi:hypothetical protein COCON_G00219520 [Conger conger]|uniref:Uncharacterized protein n=1 Tax=Conger conger TaxID=82655 RepID=A0A9Q1CYP9_CONCO|nr:hypothetical protein COCON_G00219520 [Conger conger]
MYPVPLLTIYSSTKAFVDFFSRGLNAEYKSRGIIIQSVLPFFVATKMTKIRKPTLDKPTPERYVAAELTTVGLESQTNGYFPTRSWAGSVPFSPPCGSCSTSAWPWARPSAPGT